MIFIDFAYSKLYIHVHVLLLVVIGIMVQFPHVQCIIVNTCTCVLGLPKGILF